MTTNSASNDIRSNVDNFLSTNGVKFIITGGELSSLDGWDHYAWRVTLTGKITFTTDYRTGTGLVKKRPKAFYRAAPVPVRPTAAEVLYCLVNEAEAIDESFDDWCANFGSNVDSIKDLNTYMACCATGKAMRALFTSKQLRELRTLTQDL